MNQNEMTLGQYCAGLPTHHPHKEELFELQNTPHLGCATKGELLAELIARVTVDGSINYRTSDVMKNYARLHLEMELERKTVQRLRELKTEDGETEDGNQERKTIHRRFGWTECSTSYVIPSDWSDP
jgi:hypothetical protein